jgi:hypothetical protein
MFTPPEQANSPIDSKYSNSGSCDGWGRNSPPETLGKTMQRYHITDEAVENTMSPAVSPITTYNWHRTDNPQWYLEAAREP